jgi:hypothetical protein
LKESPSVDFEDVQFPGGLSNHDREDYLQRTRVVSQWRLARDVHEEREFKESNRRLISIVKM